MKTKILLPLLFIALSFSCKKDVEPGIDYNVLTEQRILEISEQATISDEDVATLDRLLENVTDNSLKGKYTEMIAGVKILKDFIPGFNELKTNPDVLFQDLYADLEEQIKQVTDKLPRKTKLLEELESTLANYNTEEVEFLEVVLDDTGRGLRRFLANNFNIQPVEGKPTKYLRADLERVDSLVYNEGNGGEVGRIANVLRPFRGLKYLATYSRFDDVIDLNHLTNLETLEYTLQSQQPAGWQLKIDQLQNLKHLIVKENSNVRYSPFGEVIDFTDKYPLLESLDLPAVVATNLTTLLLPDKQHLTRLAFQNVNYRILPKIKRLVVEGKEIGPRSTFTVGSDSNTEIDEIRLSGFGEGTGRGEGDGGSCTLDIVGGSEVGKVKVKKLSIANVDVSGFNLGNLDIAELSLENVVVGKRERFDEFDVNVTINKVDFPQKPDFGFIDLSKVGYFEIVNVTYGGTALAFADIRTFLENNSGAALKWIYFSGLTNPPTKEYMKGLFPNLEDYYFE
ncbi:hypothetical protein [Sphingobacterium sp. JB170]|uniref:hypothetical protein n=1 Tax=Sphingobacterium sp. JB170 TaxID=1434842 RepID=UPI00097ECD14|nr:hypothetical protein [Sphingobacterium sp. JB170]SJN22712.1 hypothetical protein FM107_03485 [Sphingobacterium sp. JB170]